VWFECNLLYYRSHDRYSRKRLVFHTDRWPQVLTFSSAKQKGSDLALPGLEYHSQAFPPKV